MSDRSTLEKQTMRNLEGMDLERSGHVEQAVALYEQNVADGFEGDWPYGRLVAYYEKSGRLDAAERVLHRAIEVFRTTKRRGAEDRRATLRAFRGRLRLVQKAKRERKRASRKGR